MVREACQATIHKVARVGHDLGITPPPPQHKMPQRLEILSCFYLWGKFCFSFRLLMAGGGCLNFHPYSVGALAFSPICL